MTDLQALAETLRSMAPAVPLDRQLWSAQRIAEYLDVSPRQVTERLSARPDFPRAMRLPTDGGKGPLRWKAREVIAWAEKL